MNDEYDTTHENYDGIEEILFGKEKSRQSNFVKTVYVVTMTKPQLKTVCVSEKFSYAWDSVLQIDEMNDYEKTGQTHTCSIGLVPVM